MADEIRRLDVSAADINAALLKVTELAEQVENMQAEINAALSSKVDKVVGKQLSTNDFTDADKSKLDSLENYDDTDVKADIAEVASQAAVNRSTLGYQRKNLYKLNTSTKTVNGITFTVNDDRSITANGTATEKTIINTGNLSVSEDCILTGCPEGGSPNTYFLTIPYIGNDFGNGLKVPASTKRNVQIEVMAGVTVNDVVFRPMIRPAEIIDDTYEPYKPSVEERLAALEEKFAALEGSAT